MPAPSREADSLSDALIFLAASHGRALGREALVAGLPIEDGRLTVTLFEQAALRAGLETEAVKWDLQEIPAIVLPAVLMMKDGETRILTSSGNDPKAINPSLAPSDPVAIGADARNYLGYAFLVRPIAQTADRVTSPTTPQGRWFWSVAGRCENYRHAAIAALVVCLLVLAAPIFIGIAETPQLPEREVALTPELFAQELFEQRWVVPEIEMLRLERQASRLRGLDALRLATSAAVQSLSDVIEPAPVAIARSDAPFGMQTFRAPEGLLWLKWWALARELREEDASLRSCQADPRSCTTEAARFWSMVGQVKISRGQAQLERANRLVNSAIAYTTDLSLYGQLDKWSAPLATLELGKGDCEDYAILKYRLLAEAGVPAKDLKIILVRDTAVRIDHAVLAARANDKWFILDNRRSGFYAERDLPQYMPLFALDQNGVNLFASRFASLRARNPGDAVLPGLNER